MTRWEGAWDELRRAHGAKGDRVSPRVHFEASEVTILKRLFVQDTNDDSTGPGILLVASISVILISFRIE